MIAHNYIENFAHLHRIYKNVDRIFRIYLEPSNARKLFISLNAEERILQNVHKSILF